MLSGTINQTELLRNKENPAFFIPMELGDMTVKCKAGVTVAGVMEPFKAFAMATVEFKISAVNTGLWAKSAQVLGFAQSIYLFVNRKSCAYSDESRV